MKNGLYEQSQNGLNLLYDSIIKLLTINPNGLSNSDIADQLGLRSSHNGNQKDYLSYSLLGNLMDKNKVIKITEKRKSLYKLNSKDLIKN
jgi:hypothetical protein